MKVAEEFCNVIWRENMLGYLSTDIICSVKRTVFRERSSRKTVCFAEQIMSKENIRAYFHSHWRLLCLLSFKSFPNTCSLLLLLLFVFYYYFVYFLIFLFLFFCFSVVPRYLSHFTFVICKFCAF